MSKLPTLQGTFDKRRAFSNFYSRYRIPVTILCTITVFFLNYEVLRCKGLTPQLFNTKSSKRIVVPDNIPLLYSSSKIDYDFYDGLKQSRDKYEKFFYPVMLPNKYTGVENECNPLQQPQHTRTIHFALGVMSGTSTKSKNMREIWRENWLRWPENERQKFVMRFFMGLPNTEEEMKKLEIEAATYKDIIVLGHRDSYKNTTLKSMGIMTWGAELCGAYFVIKTDDNTFINLPALHKILIDTNPTLSYGGTVTKFKSIRDAAKKLYVSNENPVNQDLDIDKPMSCLVVLSWDLAYVISRSRLLPTFSWLEDINIGAMVAPYKPELVTDLIVLRHDHVVCEDSAIAIYNITDGSNLRLLQSNIISNRPMCNNFPSVVEGEDSNKPNAFWR